MNYEHLQGRYTNTMVKQDKSIRTSGVRTDKERPKITFIIFK